MEIQGNAVLIKPDKPLERTDKGILIPIAKKDKTSTGVVVAVGPECETVRPRMKVTFNRKGASVQTIEGEDFLLTNEMPSKIFYME